MSNSEKQSAAAGLPSSMPETGADYAHALGEYDCGNLEHEFSARLLRFKDLKGTFGRDTDGQRLYQRWFAGMVADILLEDPALAGCSLVLPVPSKLNQDPSEYHLNDLAAELERELERKGQADRLGVDYGALRFTGEVPPVKSIRLPERPCALESRIECTAELEGREVVLLDDIIASGATAAECVRAIRAAGAVKVALLALARRVS